MAKSVSMKQLELAPERLVGQRIKIKGCTMVQPDASLNMVVEELYSLGVPLPEGGCFGFMFMHDTRPMSASIGIASTANFLDTFIGISSNATVDFEGYVIPNTGLETLPDSFLIYVDSVKVVGNQREVNW